MSIEQAREKIAAIAETHGEFTFAREVRAGCWDHRRDVQHVLGGSIGHTPGPWKFEISRVRKTPCVMAGDTWVCGEIYNPNNSIGREALANAKLIAAAPDLLDVLENLVNVAPPTLTCGLHCEAEYTASDCETYKRLIKQADDLLVSLKVIGAAA